MMHILFTSTVLSGFILNLACFTQSSQLLYENIAKVIHLQTRASVHLKGSHGYYQKRKVQNGACVNIYPDLIVVPKTTKDVATIISVATKFKAPISVKSGGHSYICQGIKSGKLKSTRKIIL